MRLQLILYAGCYTDKNRQIPSLECSIGWRSGSLDSCGICLIWFSCSSNSWMTMHAPRMTALSSCTKALVSGKTPKTYYRARAIIIQWFLPFPQRGLSGPRESQKNALRLLSWIISIRQRSVSSILAVTVYVWFSTVWDKAPRYPDTFKRSRIERWKKGAPCTGNRQKGYERLLNGWFIL